MTYHDLVNVDDFEKREYFNTDRGDVAFYCKDCKKIVKTERLNPDGYTFLCTVCEGKNIVIGTEEGLKTNYRLK